MSVHEGGPGAVSRRRRRSLRPGSLRTLTPVIDEASHQEASVHVALANGRSLARAGLSSILEEDRNMSVVAEAASVDLLLSSSENVTPDVVVLDADLPGLDLRRDAARLDAPVVLLGNGEDQGRAWSALSSGVRGFVDREQSAHDIRTAVHAVGSGEACFPPRMVGRLLDAALAHGDMEVTAPAALVGTLTRRENEVLRQMVQGHGNGEIAKRLVIQPSTVKSHVNSILRKLAVADRTQAVILAMRTHSQVPRLLIEPCDDVARQPKKSSA